jgi:hypothetical protein
MRSANDKGGGMATTAAAREFPGIIYRTLKDDCAFRDFHYFVVAGVGASTSVRTTHHRRVDEER